MGGNFQKEYFAAEVIHFCLQVTQRGLLIQEENCADKMVSTLIGLISRTHV
jgi:hypothetical protein